MGQNCMSGHFGTSTEVSNRQFGPKCRTVRPQDPNCPATWTEVLLTVGRALSEGYGAPLVRGQKLILCGAHHMKLISGHAPCSGAPQWRTWRRIGLDVRVCGRRHARNDSSRATRHLAIPTTRPPHRISAPRRHFTAMAPSWPHALFSSAIMAPMFRAYHIINTRPPPTAINCRI